MKSNIKQRAPLLAIASAIAISSAGVGLNAFAATDTSDMVFSASVVATCTITADPVAFGTYDPTSATATTANGAVQVLCTNGTAGYITLGQGTAAVGDVPGAPVRRMSGGAAAAGRLGYFIYTDVAMTTTWGNTGATGVNHVGTGIPAAITVYGRIPAEQNVIAGSNGTAYADTVVATITL